MPPVAFSEVHAAERESTCLTKLGPRSQPWSQPAPPQASGLRGVGSRALFPQGVLRGEQGPSPSLAEQHQGRKDALSTKNELLDCSCGARSLASCLRKDPPLRSFFKCCVKPLGNPSQTPWLLTLAQPLTRTCPCANHFSFCLSLLICKVAVILVSTQLAEDYSEDSVNCFPIKCSEGPVNAPRM